MKQLIIIGAGDSAKEIFAWASPFFSNNQWVFKGFLDDTKPNVLGKIKEYTPEKDDVFVCSIGTPQARSTICDFLRKKGAIFINLIHPSAIILSDIKATGLVIAPFAFVSCNVYLEDDVMMNVSASAGHDVIIRSSSVLSAHVDLTGHVEVGKQVLFGTHACVIPNKKIGDSVVVGAGSAVIRDVPSNTTVIGVPAKKLGD